MPDTSMALTVIPASGVDTYRMSTDAASISKAIVIKTAMEIQGRKYVKVEGWQAIALAHGCTASSCNVERIDDGFRATGQVRRMDTGGVIAEAEGFVGDDEPVWFGGETTDKWGKKKVYQKRPDYAIRAMAQTRAISRACRSAFAHVVVMMDAGLQTTPAEEVPAGGFDDEPQHGATGTAGAGTQFRPERRGSNWVEESRQDGTLDETRAKGTMPGKAAAETPPPEVDKYKIAVDKRIAHLKSQPTWTREDLDALWNYDEKWILWMSDPDNKQLVQYQRFLDAFSNAEMTIQQLEPVR